MLDKNTEWYQRHVFTYFYVPLIHSAAQLGCYFANTMRIICQSKC
jgi:hypothetical protein